MFLSKYGVARHIYIPIVKRAVVDFAVSADWTPAAGDVKISKDGGAAANVTNLPTAIAMGNGAIWDFSLTATEMQAAQIVVTVADSATKAVEDQSFIIETHGNASAQFQVDLADSVRAGLTALPNATVSGVGGLLTAPTTANVGLADLSRILGTALTETAGQIAAGFKKVFDVAAPVFTAASVNQTGDSYARLGAPAGASIAADLVTIDDFLDTEVAAIKAKTDQLTFTVANTLNVAVTHWVATAVATVDTAGYPVVTVKDGTGVGELNTAGGRVSSDVTRWLGTAVATPTVAGVPMVEVVSADAAGKTDIRSAVGLASANLDTQLDALPTNAELATALGTADDAVLAQVALVKAKTDSLTFTVAGHADVNLQYVNDVQVNGTGAAGNEWGP